MRDSAPGARYTMGISIARKGKSTMPDQNRVRIDAIEQDDLTGLCLMYIGHAQHQIFNPRAALVMPARDSSTPRAAQTAR